MLLKWWYLIFLLWQNINDSVTIWKVSLVLMNLQSAPRLYGALTFSSWFSWKRVHCINFKKYVNVMFTVCCPPVAKKISFAGWIKEFVLLCKESKSYNFGVKDGSMLMTGTHTLTVPVFPSEIHRNKSSVNLKPPGRRRSKHPGLDSFSLPASRSSQ